MTKEAINMIRDLWKSQFNTEETVESLVWIVLLYGSKTLDVNKEYKKTGSM